jgi:ssRNA-specific RNase YbeY (16S rRNA maturation enzyme)
MLHILGYDHLMPDREKIMLRKQKTILKGLGLERGKIDE